MPAARAAGTACSDRGTSRAQRAVSLRQKRIARRAPIGQPDREPTAGRCRRRRRAVVERVEGDVQRVGQVLDREELGDVASQSGASVSGYQMPEMKDERQDQHVGDDRRGLGVGDDA